MNLGNGAKVESRYSAAQKNQSMSDEEISMWLRNSKDHVMKGRLEAWLSLRRNGESLPSFKSFMDYKKSHKTIKNQQAEQTKTRKKQVYTSLKFNKKTLSIMGMTAQPVVDDLHILQNFYDSGQLRTPSMKRAIEKLQALSVKTPQEPPVEYISKENAEAMFDVLRTSIYEDMNRIIDNQNKIIENLKMEVVELHRAIQAKEKVADAIIEMSKAFAMTASKL